MGHDCRRSSPALAEGLIDGITSRGVDVMFVGEISTDMLYYAAGAYEVPGVVITASHNPAQWNGMKFCLAGAAPVGEETGLADIRRTAENPPDDRPTPGSVTPRDSRVATSTMCSRSSTRPVRPLRVAADGGNGMAGACCPMSSPGFPPSSSASTWSLTATSPTTPPIRSAPRTSIDLLALMEAERPDLGVAFDGDADRAFFVDDLGQPLPGSTTTAIVADWFLAREPGATIVHNLICSKAVPETITASGGVPIRTRVGHSFIKQVMKDSGAVFGGEHSGHYYFRDNYRADSGILALLVLLQVISEDGRPLSALRADYEPYAQSGEINFEVTDKQGATEAVQRPSPTAPPTTWTA